MRRREYLSGVGAAASLGLAGCARARRGVELVRKKAESVKRDAENAQAASGFDFPPGLSSSGVDSYEKLFLAHVNALVERTFRDEFVEDPEVERTGGRVRSAGTPGSIRWSVEHDATWYSELYFDEDIQFAGSPVGVEQKPSHLRVGTEDRNFSTWLGDAVGARFWDALALPYGHGELTVRTEGDTDVAVFVAEEAPSDDRDVAEVKRLELAVGADGIIRRIDARYTEAIRGQPSGEKRFDYSIELGAEPSEDLSGYPDAVNGFPTFRTEWQDDGRVLAVTNTGGAPVVGEGASGELFLSGLTVGESAHGANVSVPSPLEPGQTGYIAAADGVALTASPPEESTSFIRDEEKELRFWYRYDAEEHGGPYDLEHAGRCDGLDC